MFKRTYFATLFIIFSASISAFDILHFNQSSDSVNGVTFPRVKSLKYRGVPKAQMNEERAVKGMLGSDESSIDSLAFFAFKRLLQKKEVPFYSSLNNFSYEFERKGFLEQARLLLNANQGLAFSEKKSRRLSLQIFEKYFKELTKDEFTSFYLNYTDSDYNDWPIDMVFTTTYLEVANIYSDSIVIIDEAQTRPNSVDLNFWNKKVNGEWVYTDNSWVDKGEFIHPYMIPSKQIIGFKKYRSKWPTHTVYRDLVNQLRYVLYKVEVDDKEYVAVVDGNNAQAIKYNSIKKKFEYQISQFQAYDEIPLQLKMISGTPQIIGLITLCSETEECILSSKVKKVFPIRESKGHLALAAIKSALGFKINDSVVKLFNNSDDSIEPGRLVSMKKNEVSISVNGMSRIERVKHYASIDKEHNVKAVIDLKDRHTDINKIKLNFKDFKLDPKKKDSIYIEVPEKFSGKSIKSVKLEVRQDPSVETGLNGSGRWDQTPGYLSVQFNSVEFADSWRFWGGKQRHPTPYASVFAETIQRDAMKVSTLINYSVNGHKGYYNNVLSTLSLKVDALRLIAYGDDPVLLNTVIVEFE